MKRAHTYYDAKTKQHMEVVTSKKTNTPTAGDVAKAVVMTVAATIRLP